MLVFTFPGQGSQRPGMGAPWIDHPSWELVTDASEAVDRDVAALLLDAGQEELTQTRNAQLACFTLSMVVLDAIERTGLAPVAAAGHSLGEYSALVAAGALGFADALRLVRRRGQLMQEAVPVGQGAMAAIIGLDPEAIAGIATESAQGEICAVANFNGPSQTVIAGSKGAVDRAVVLARERGARKATLLAVSAPFHSPLMRPAREGMAPLLAATAFEDPRLPVVSNVDAAPVASGETARDALVRQIDSPVRWVESISWMEEALGVEVFVEVGPGNVLSGLNRRIVKAARSTAVTDPDHLRQLLEETEEES